HGTVIGGIVAAKKNDIGIVGVAPDANLFSVKAIGQDGEGNLIDLLEAIDWSIDNEMNIINLSLGIDFNSDTLEALLNKAYENGILMVGASGNWGNNSLVAYPAMYESVIGV